VYGPSTEQLTQVIAHAMAPAFRLGAVAGFLGLLMGRMNGRVLKGSIPSAVRESSLFIDIFGRWRMFAREMAVGTIAGSQRHAYDQAPPPPPAVNPGPAGALHWG
jgi:hypothetical protein